ncbi:MAG: TetR/AcrR family transcriptional regulator [Desulfobacterales bacterium]|nr:TetR/AcrR family transcriptional regulator [Desulfobacterales bacterium]MBS3755528.1 TetR/AcrR family transcriptional regulator [Desulfobacterales bacterium]
MKARILEAARKAFGEYGFHGTTTRMIANVVDIDISTLYYHWGEKGDLYEAVIRDINDGMGGKLVEVEKKIKGKPLARRLDIAIDEMVDYLFENPEISNLTLFRYFMKTRHGSLLDFRVPEYLSDIAYSMGLAEDRKNVPVEARMKVLSIMNAIHNFVSGENFFRPMMELNREQYIRQAKETLKFFNLAAFT